ncbi:Quinolinate phosphoribosyltransferase protein [Halorhabdus tiamatea SARL4B]|uniref:Nicotinate-nucleotide pyrophosphorylase [carboxylating] n=1 Tax=Halorhabdus tiamatea SARL4B TaxID=1033806 RepID=F7PJE0_9EURY|nr:carboxylating nicotinate-nucleotide diphosphorylase [Halorhabdus tiamatea]ERJ05482.1 Quinolinate phosphoribosyltransferase protein [Halorhabdus tiamatea SARL4B]CCQ33596.1 nicotinate-nucleotide pyrophosphorylase [Halorhabdus tiamatea SARL4B]
MITDGDVESWLREDLGHHDVTNHLPGRTDGRLVAKEEGVAAGIDAAEAVFEYLDCPVESAVGEGTVVEPGDVLLTVSGPTRDVLRGERPAVNVAAHASGIATKTREAVEAALEVNEDVEIAGTRKTTPGLRGVEKRAVVAGGGDTHRLDLSHMAMVKDNHVAEMGLAGAVEHVAEQTSFATQVEVEVEKPKDAPRAAEAGADIVLLDNMSPADCERAVERLAEAGHDAVLTEASGGITIETVPAYAKTGVDVISMGSLTHSAAALDLSFRTGEGGN